MNSAFGEFSPATLKLAKNVPFTFKGLLQRYLKIERLTDLAVVLRVTTHVATISCT